MAAGCDKPGSTLQFLRKFIEVSGRSMQKKKENHKENLKYSGRMEKRKERATKSYNKLKSQFLMRCPKKSR